MRRLAALAALMLAPTAASASTPYQPSITVSVTCSAICAKWLPISGRPRTSRARAWAGYVRRGVMGVA